MKKLITAAMALALFAGIASAQVNSDNIVGYQSHATVGGNYNLPAVQWNSVGGGNVAISNLFADTSMLTQGSGLVDADYIQVWNPVTSGYAQYFLYNDESGYNPEWDGEWLDNSNPAAGPTGETLAPGSAFWLLRQSGVDTNLVSAGEVASVAQFTFNITKNNYNMIANAYPTDLQINSTNFVIDITKAVQGSGLVDADYIQVWNPVTSGYAQYFLYNDESGYNPEWDGKWLDNSNPAAGPTASGLPAGFGAWYLSQPATATDWTLTIKKPY
jgi:hypothetical protein